MAQRARRQRGEAVEPVAPARLRGQRRQVVDQRQREAAEIVEGLEVPLDCRDLRGAGLVGRQLAQAERQFLAQAAEPPPPARGTARRSGLGGDRRVDEQRLPAPRRADVRPLGGGNRTPAAGSAPGCAARLRCRATPGATAGRARAPRRSRPPAAAARGRGGRPRRAAAPGRATGTRRSSAPRGRRRRTRAAPGTRGRSDPGVACRARTTPAPWRARAPARSGPSRRRARARRAPSRRRPRRAPPRRGSAARPRPPRGLPPAPRRTGRHRRRRPTARPARRGSAGRGRARWYRDRRRCRRASRRPPRAAAAAGRACGASPAGTVASAAEARASSAATKSRSAAVAIGTSSRTSGPARHAAGVARPQAGGSRAQQRGAIGEPAVREQRRVPGAETRQVRSGGVERAQALRRDAGFTQLPQRLGQGPRQARAVGDGRQVVERAVAGQLEQGAGGERVGGQGGRRRHAAGRQRRRGDARRELAEGEAVQAERGAAGDGDAAAKIVGGLAGGPDDQDLGGGRASGDEFGRRLEPHLGRRRHDRLGCHSSVTLPQKNAGPGGRGGQTPCTAGVAADRVG